MTDNEVPVTARGIAEWMLAQVKERPRFYQERAVREIRQKFGDAWWYKNANGNMAIDKGVLREFKKISGNEVIWERGDRAWRVRRDRDKPGRQQY